TSLSDSISIFSFIFFFHVCRVHQYLHSFPTRRSSDLVVDGKKVTFSDGSSLDVNQIIWATGFVPAYEMIRIDGTIDKKGKPIHTRGISPIDGLYYIGLPWQHSRGSALICGVGRDAMFLADNIF